MNSLSKAFKTSNSAFSLTMTKTSCNQNAHLSVNAGFQQSTQHRRATRSEACETVIVRGVAWRVAPRSTLHTEPAEVGWRREDSVVQRADRYTAWQNAHHCPQPVSAGRTLAKKRFTKCVLSDLTSVSWARAHRTWRQEDAKMWGQRSHGVDTTTRLKESTSSFAVRPPGAMIHSPATTRLPLFAPALRREQGAVPR